MTVDDADGRDPQGAGDPWPPEDLRRPSYDDYAHTLRGFVTRHLLTGLLGSVALAIGAIGVGWLPPPNPPYFEPSFAIGEALRSDFGLWVSRALVIIGGALLLQSWLVLGIDVLRGSLTDLRRLWATLAAWTLPLLFVPPLFSRDVYSYFAQGKLLLAGINPYTAGVAELPGWFQDGVDPMWAETPTPYGPLWLALSRGVVAFVGDNVYLGMLMFRLLSVIGVVLLAWYLPRLAFLCGIRAPKALWLGVMNPLVLMLFVVSTHNDALMIGLTVAGLTLVGERRPVLGVLLITAAVAIKPVALVALPFAGLLWAGSRADVRRRVLRWVQTGAIAASAFAVFTAVVGTGFGWLAALSTPGQVTTWLSPPCALGMVLGRLGDHLGLGDHTDQLISVLRVVAMLVAGIILARLVLKPEGRTPVRGLALAFMALVLLGPTFQTWYLLWVIPLAAVSGMSGRWLRATLLLIAGGTIYTLCETSATSDTLLRFGDAVAMAVTVVVVAGAVIASGHERSLVFAEQVDAGLVPEDGPSRARHDALIVRPAA